MPLRKPSTAEKEALQTFYLSCRNLLNGGIIPPICVQRAFEEVVGGFTMEDTWRPTHISLSALAEAAKGCHTSIQRAHGVLDERLDRFVRTIRVLSGPEKKFEEWWDFYIDHDTTVLITREEHSLNKKFERDDLIPVPQDTDLFKRGGFSFRFRKKHELKWAKAKLEELKCPGTTE